LDVESAARLPFVLASVGVREGIALSPTAGAALFARTTTLPIACTRRFPPTGDASSQYFPGAGNRIRAT
jgi:hypothetical protein